MGLRCRRGLCARLEREWRVVAALTQRLQALRADRRELLQTSDDPAIARVQQLLALRGITYEKPDNFSDRFEPRREQGHGSLLSGNNVRAHQWRGCAVRSTSSRRRGKAGITRARSRRGATWR
jgi:hypothetical protein